MKTFKTIMKFPPSKCNSSFNFCFSDLRIVWCLVYIKIMSSPIFFEFERFLKILLNTVNVPLCSVGMRHIVHVFLRFHKFGTLKFLNIISKFMIFCIHFLIVQILRSFNFSNLTRNGTLYSL